MRLSSPKCPATEIAANDGPVVSQRKRRKGPRTSSHGLTLLADTLLQATVAGEAPDLVADDVEFGLVVLRRELFRRDRETDRVRDSLSLFVCRPSQRAATSAEGRIGNS